MGEEKSKAGRKMDVVRGSEMLGKHGWERKGHDRREQTREKELGEARHPMEVSIMKLVVCLRHDNAIVGWR
jgi:hypothetical protein